MAVFGSIDILTQLIGGQQVLNQLNQIRTAGQQIGATPINVNVQSANLNTFNNSLATTSRTLGNFSQSWDRTLQGISRLSDGLTHAGQVAATFAYRLTLITAPIDLLIAKSMQFTVGLEYSLAKVGTQLDGTLSQIRQFAAESKAITLDLQAQYGVNAQEQSQSLYYLVSSGISQEQAQRSLAPLAKLSAVTQTSPAIASQALVATMNVFGDELERFPNLADRTTYALEVMFDATRKGRFEFTDFATQFGRAAEQMHMANATFEETSAMLATLSQVFTPSQASTTLNSFAKAFLNPVEKAKEAFEELGVLMYETIDGKRVRREFGDVFEETFDKIGQLAAYDQERADKLLGALFGDLRGGRGAQMLADPRNRRLYSEILAEIQGSTDNIGQAWELMAEQIQVSINQTIGMFYKLGDAVVKNLEPTIRGALAGIQVFFKGLTENPQVAQMIAQLGAGLAVAAPAALVFATALMGVGGLITALATLMTPAYLIGFSALIAALAPAFTNAASASYAFGGGLNGILATLVETGRQLGIISDIDAFGILEKLGVKIDTNAYDSVKNFVSELRKLGDDAAVIGNGIKTIAEGIAQLLDNIGKGKGILGFLATLAANIAGIGTGSIGLAGSGGIAEVLDKVIGGLLVARLASIAIGLSGGTASGILGGIGAIGAAQLAMLGIPTTASAIPTTMRGALMGGLGIGSFAAGGAFQAQRYAEANQQNQLGFGIGQGGKGVVISSASGVLASAVSQTINDIASFILKREVNFQASLSSEAEGLGFKIGTWLRERIDEILGRESGAAPVITGEARKIIYDRSKDTLLERILRDNGEIGNAISDEPASLRRAKDAYSFAKATAVLDKEAIEVAKSFRAVGTSANALANAATRAASQLAGIAGMTLGMGYFAPPGVGDTARYAQYARGSAIDARYASMYPAEMEFISGRFDERIGNWQAAKDALGKFTSAAEDAAKRLADAVRGLVSEALGATSVTEKDQERMDLQKELSKLNARLANDNLGRQQQKIVESRIGEISVRLEQLGAYKDQPDEFARRTRAVATGTDPATYGQAYQEQLALAQSKMPGASLEDIAAAFGDKSLFAKMTPDEIDQMWNWDAVVDSVRRGIDRIVGEWKLMKQAVGEVMSQLTNDEIASLKEALGLGAGTSLDDLASKFLGQTTGLGADGKTVGGTIDEETMGTFGGFADILERIKDNADIVVKMSFDEKMWEKAKEAIDAAEEYIREHLAKYADIFIQITARFSEESGGGDKPPDGGGSDGGKPPPEGKATGGYVTEGIYKVGEQGYEYVLPHPLTKWIETMMGGKINSPNDIMWLIQALLTPGGKSEALAKAADWAATQHGGYYEMPKNFAKWIDRIGVIYDDEKMSLNDALWHQGNPSVTTNAGGGGGGAGGTGSGGSGDLSALKASFDGLISALNRLTRSIDAMSRVGFQTPQPVADYVGGSGARNTSGGNNSETIVFYGDIVAPNQATVKTLYDSIMDQTRRNTSARANHGMA